MATFEPQVPTIILVGGRMTMDDGSTLDTRQRAVETDWDPSLPTTRQKSIPAGVTTGMRTAMAAAIHVAMATSITWWTLVAPLVERLLDASKNREPFALVLGPNSVVEARPDKSLRNVRLASLFRMSPGRVKVARFGVTHHLPNGYRLAGDFRSEQDPDYYWKIGFTLEGNGARWRFCEGNPRYLPVAVQAMGASVIVDTASFNAPGSLSDPTAVVVTPHTALRERLLRKYLSSVRRGSPNALVPYDQGSSQWAHHSALVPVEARFGVTGLVRNGRFSDGRELEAARALLQSRFDLNLGIWDLADNPTLRQSLLNVQASPQVPRRESQLAIDPRQLSKERPAARRDPVSRSARFDTEVAKAIVREAFRPLEQIGWQYLPVYGLYELPLTHKVEPSPGGRGGPGPWLGLMASKRATRVSLRPAYVSDFKIHTYIAGCRAALKDIAAPYRCSLDLAFPNLLELPGGSDDQVDWPSHLYEIDRRTPEWTAQLRPLFETVELPEQSAQDQPEPGSFGKE